MGFINRFAINRICNSTPPRPRPFGLWSEAPNTVSDYSSWPSLTEREYFDRHLPPADPAYINNLPPDEPYQHGTPPAIGKVTDLFRRNAQIDSQRSTLLFTTFAQWFTDSILRVNPKDRRKNTSKHEINLCQIYGLEESTADCLRSNELGRLKSQIINDEEYSPHLYEPDGQPKKEFSDLPYLSILEEIIWKHFPEDRKSHYYATGLERGNSTIGYTALNTLFLREHNRLCNELHKRYPTWNDERLFQTARNISIVLLLKLVVEDYINHIVPSRLINFELELGFAEDQKWYRTNWIALEFDMLYRWHSLVPELMEVGGTQYGPDEYRVNNVLLENAGLGAAIQALSTQPAGKIGLHNSPNFLLRAEYITIAMGRRFQVQSFNDYRERFGLKRLRNFSELTRSSRTAEQLTSLYGKIDNLELYVGLFAEDATDRALFGELMTRMVAIDAFSQIFTNPLLANAVYTASTFSKFGLDVIEETESIQDLVNRNVYGDLQIRASLGF